MEHQRRPLHRRRHGRHEHRQRPHLQPGHQVRVLRPEQQHRLPRHQAVSASLRVRASGARRNARLAGCLSLPAPAVSVRERA